MTENQRDYIADLAARKGVVLQDTDNMDTSLASVKIDELKALPDSPTHEITTSESEKINKMTERALRELEKWTFRQ